MKPVLGHVEFMEEEDTTKSAKQEPPTGEPPCKRRATQSISSLKEAKCKENIEKQEQRWLELTQGQEASSSAGGSAAAGSVITSTTSMVTSTSNVTSTVDVEAEVDLEEAMHSQDDDDDGYGKKYKMTSEDRTDRSAA